MATISPSSSNIPRLDLTSLSAIKSQRPAHVPRSAFLTRPPQAPSLSQGLQQEDIQVDMDVTNNITDPDTFGAGTQGSDFPNSHTDRDAFSTGTAHSDFSKNSRSATPVASKRVRAVSEEASPGMKRARLDNGTSNSKKGSTSSSGPPKEKKKPEFAVGYVSGGKPKAADYEDVVQALLLRAMHEYESRIVGVTPYPDSANQSKWTKICWKEACSVAAEDYSMTERMSKMVCIKKLPT